MVSPVKNKGKLTGVSRLESILSYGYLFLVIFFSVAIIHSLFGGGGLSTYTFMSQDTSSGVHSLFGGGGLSTYTFMSQDTSSGVLHTLSQRRITIPPPILARNVTNDPPVVATASSNGSSSSRDVSDDGNIECDIFKGEWVPNPEGRHYSTNCSMILEHNCINNGRQDLGFLKWKWRPSGGPGCGDLPDFDPFEFLQTVKGKSIAFVGDSIGRNQMQSLICLLSEVELPEQTSSDNDNDNDAVPHWRFKSANNDVVPHWRFKSVNFTVALLWSPFLVRTSKQDTSKSKTTPKSEDHTSRINMYLDEPDETWTNKIQHFDYIIISAGHWFNHPLYYYTNGQPIGCTYTCDDSIKDGKNLTTVYPIPYGYRAAFRTSFKAILDISRKGGFNGTVFLRTFSPGHFEGVWNQGADCPRTEPRKNGEISLEDEKEKFYIAQLQEFNHAKEEGRGIASGIKFRMLNVTQAMLLRPDGHPNRNRGDPMQADCLHWCLPGPVDYWNTFLLYMIKR